MKKIIIKYIGLSLMALLFLPACEDYLGGDTNVDPTKVADPNLESLLPTTIFFTSQAYFDVAIATSQISQHTASFFDDVVDNHEPTELASAWENIYLNALPNLEIIVEKGMEGGNNHYVGIAKVLQATNLGLATDQWGDIPFSQAFQGENDFTPAYDSQEQIYETIQQLLEEATTNLQQEDNSLNQPGNDDLIYSGDISKWLKAARALRARYAIHLTKKGVTTAANNALSFLDGAFTDNDDNMELVYNTRNLNPWHTNVALANRTGNLSVLLSDQLVSNMNGTTFPFANIDIDPRLPIIAGPSEISGNLTEDEELDEYFGGINGAAGEGRGPGGSSNANFNVFTFYSTPEAPIFIITYSETKFIESEAHFILGNMGSAYDAYLEGIRAHMERIGVSEEDIQAYLNDPSVAVGPSNISLQLIMREKITALFLNPETWTDLRRYDFDPNIFKDLELPVDHNPELGGEWIRRVLYPESEFTRNETEVKKVERDLGEKVWWDQ